jgi:general secretion pathway protein G
MYGITGKRTRRGFTLVELLLVLMILATLAAIVIPKMAGRSRQAKETAAQSQITNFESALDAFEIDNGFFPSGNNGMNALIEKPNSSKNWRGPYLKKGIPKDPWGNSYIYEYPGKHNSDGYDISSTGPDGKNGGDDDLTNWTTESKTND